MPVVVFHAVPAPKGGRPVARPAVGAALRRCAECGGCEYSGAPACTACRELVDGILEDEWSAFLRQWGASGSQEAAALAEVVAAGPDRHDWRVVDAALDRLVCSACGDRPSRGLSRLLRMRSCSRLPLCRSRDGPARCPARQRAHH
ncbi:conserved hypothetical protein [Streptomyces himastatinicus ATCC 53653]|uniref:Uncharacterized protein n=1 Tax=Streptomyces himastatinicus ATCC 53653 TaxID=457427 RepID=D9W5X5_9ACTN|nr:conserved hypothetical protein [Streptomyces himastatinicus ATCC 53653]